MTHEQFIAAVRDAALPRVEDKAAKNRLASAKLTYGAGESGTRGITYYSAWKNGDEKPLEFIEVCAVGEQSPVQLAGTTLHELGHVLAGTAAGHGKDWKAACAVLGLHHAEAAGQEYSIDHFDADIQTVVRKLTAPTDGTPQFGYRGSFLGLPVTKFRPCPLGIGTHGGKSRGKGSGSRLRLFVCDCNPPIKVRVARDEFAAHCDTCGAAFKREQ
jgi:hypothetical protein